MKKETVEQLEGKEMKQHLLQFFLFLLCNCFNWKRTLRKLRNSLYSNLGPSLLVLASMTLLPNNNNKEEKEEKEEKEDEMQCKFASSSCSVESKKSENYYSSYMSVCIWFMLVTKREENQETARTGCVRYIL